MALIDEKFFSYEGSIEYLSSFSRTGAPITNLSRFSALAAELSNPQKKLRCIHVVGTNGKGSVTEYLASALTACGYKTGRFTSPYILDIRERITIDGEFISQTDFARLVGIVAGAVERCENKAFSQFEILTAVCFLYFAENQVDFCCLEAGIGGTLDCTNIIEPPEAAVITSIGLDHTAILGNTAAEIARSKCGVIKGGRAVAAADIPTEAMAVIRRRCAETGAQLAVPNLSRLIVFEAGLSGSRFSYCGEEYRIRMCGEHQIGNCLTAIEALRELGLPQDKVKQGLARAVMPARLEQLGRIGGKDILLDGGHNPQAMEAARAVLEQDCRRKTALIGMIDTKDYSSALKILLPCFERVVFLDGFASNSVSAEQLCAVAQGMGVECLAAHDASAALETALNYTGKTELLFIGGSLYMAADIRARLLKMGVCR